MATVLTPAQRNEIAEKLATVLRYTDHSNNPASIYQFSNNRIALSQRRLKGLAWLDANGDGLIDSRDPVFTQLKVWQDSNQNGVMEDMAATLPVAGKTEGRAGHYGEWRASV